jgi:hypothetical protein
MLRLPLLHRLLQLARSSPRFKELYQLDERLQLSTAYELKGSSVSINMFLERLNKTRPEVAHRYKDEVREYTQFVFMVCSATVTPCHVKLPALNLST